MGASCSATPEQKPVSYPTSNNQVHPLITHSPSLSDNPVIAGGDDDRSRSLNSSHQNTYDDQFEPSMGSRKNRRPSVMTQSPQVVKLELIKVPKYTGGVFSRVADENRIRMELTKVCIRPGEGVLVIAGDSGVGKTVLLSSLFKKELLKDDGENGGPSMIDKTTAVMWLNCIQWRDRFDDGDKKAFDRELVELAKHYDPDFLWTTPARIVPHFSEKINARVLFIFDDLFNPDVLQYFCSNQKNKALLSCCAITTDPIPSSFTSLDGLVRKVETIANLTDQDMQKMLEDYYDMKEKLTTDEVATLVKMCCGLPQLASLVRAPFGPDDGLTLWGDVYSELVASISTSKTPRLSMASRNKLDTVLTLFEFSIDRLSDDLRHSYYVFLFFEPNVPVSLADLKLFWGTRCLEYASSLIAASLVREAEASTDDDRLFIVHIMLYEGALEKASKEFQLVGTAERRLQHFRMMLLGIESVEMVMFEATRQQRLSLCQRFVNIVDAEHLLTLCEQTSAKVEDRGRSFLEFLYHTAWPEHDTNFSITDIPKRYGINTSYRLLKVILQKLDSGNKLSTLFQPVQNVVPIFLKELFDDENSEAFYWDRRHLTMIVDRWHWIYDEDNWRKQILAGQQEKDVFLATIIANDQAKFKVLHQRVIDQDWPTFVDEYMGEAEAAAARCGRVDILQYILEKDKRPKKNGNNTPITYAAQNGSLDIVKFLVERDSDFLTDFDADGRNALMAASRNGHIEVVKYLIGKEPRLTGQGDNQGRTAMMLAAESGCLEVVQLLANNFPETITHLDNAGKSSIMLASENGHLDIIKFLVEKDPSALLQTDKTGKSAVYPAADNGHSDIVRFLAEQNPKTLEKDNTSWTPLMSACLSGRFDVIHFLFDNDPKTLLQADHGGSTALMIAAANGHYEVSKFLADSCPQSIGKTNKFSRKALMYAAENGHLAIVKLLGERDSASMWHADKLGYTALILASEKGHFEIAKFLVAQDSRTLQSGCFGWTPVACAAGGGHLEIVKFLAEKDPKSLSASDKAGYTPMIFACRSGHLDVAKFLYELDPSSLTKFDADSRSPLNWAARHGHVDLVKFLVDKNAKMLSYADKRGKTPMLSAIDCGFKELAEYLVAKYTEYKAAHRMSIDMGLTK